MDNYSCSLRLISESGVLPFGYWEGSNNHGVALIVLCMVEELWNCFSIRCDVVYKYRWFFKQDVYLIVTIFNERH